MKVQSWSSGRGSLTSCRICDFCIMNVLFISLWTNIYHKCVSIVIKDIFLDKYRNSRTCFRIFKYLSISMEPEELFFRKILKVQIFNLKRYEINIKCSERLTLC